MSDSGHRDLGEIFAQLEHVDDPDVHEKAKTNPTLAAAYKMLRPGNWLTSPDYSRECLFRVYGLCFGVSGGFVGLTGPGGCCLVPLGWSQGRCWTLTWVCGRDGSAAA